MINFVFYGTNEMKKIIIFLLGIVLFFNSNNLISQDLTKLYEINFADKGTFKGLDFITIKFYSSKKKFLKEVLGIEFYKLINAQKYNISKEDFNKLVMIAYSKEGKKVQFSYSDISPNISKIPTYIAFREKLILPDTLTVSNFKGTKLNEAQKKKIADVFTFANIYKIYLQIPTIPKETIDKIFKNYFIIFPQDNSIDRWVGDLEKIEIYKIK
jgi:hypothetical protein